MTLRRGENVALTREIPSLTSVVLGVRWDAGPDAALDASLVAATLLCDSASRVLSDEHLVFFNQLVSPDLSVAQLTAAVGSDKEQIEVDLHDVPAEVERLVVALYINDGVAARRTLGQLRSCAIRVLDREDNRELVSSEELATVLSTETALVLGELYRHRSGWKFKVIGQGYESGLRGVAQDYGVRL
ncbi:MAG TPA: TerD family protein [Mycobacteriales bacterium]|nr:TerD family protein [Mycobacteriales bacterium]